MKSLIKSYQVNFMIIMLLLIIDPPLFGQRPLRKEMREKIESQEAAMITQKLQLTPDEAKTFWPVFNEYRLKKEQLNKDFRDKYGKKFMDNESLSEQEYKELADSQIKQDVFMLDLRKEYHNRFLSVLPASKVFKLYQVEKQFRRDLLERLKDQKGRKGPGGPRGPRDQQGQKDQQRGDE